MRVILVVNEPVFRLGLHNVLARSGDVQLVGDAPDARAAFPRIDSEHPDVVVMDITLPGMSGITATREIRRRAPRALILLLASWRRERDALDGFAAGAHGLALKSESPEALLHALRTLAQGQTYMTPGPRGCATGGATSPDGSLDLLGGLSPREREVLDLVIKGWRNRDVARELCISIKTVDTHRVRINRKLHCGNGAELMRFAADNDLLRGSPWPLDGQATGPFDSDGDAANAPIPAQSGPAPLST